MYVYGRIGKSMSVMYTMEYLRDPIPEGQALMVGYPPEPVGNTDYIAQADGTWKLVNIPPPAKPIFWWDDKLQMQNPDQSFSPMASTQVPGLKRTAVRTITLNSSGVAVVDLADLGFADFNVMPQVGIDSNNRVVLASASAKDISGTKRLITITGRRAKIATTLADLLSGLFEPAAGQSVVLFIQEA